MRAHGVMLDMTIGHRLLFHESILVTCFYSFNLDIDENEFHGCSFNLLQLNYMTVYVLLS